MQGRWGGSVRGGSMQVNVEIWTQEGLVVVGATARLVLHSLKAATKERGRDGSMAAIRLQFVPSQKVGFCRASIGKVCLDLRLEGRQEGLLLAQAVSCELGLLLERRGETLASGKRRARLDKSMAAPFPLPSKSITTQGVMQVPRVRARRRARAYHMCTRCVRGVCRGSPRKLCVPACRAIPELAAVAARTSC